MTVPVDVIELSNRMPRPPLSSMARRSRLDFSSRVTPFVVLIEMLPRAPLVNLQVVCLLLFVPQSMMWALHMVRRADVEA